MQKSFKNLVLKNHFYDFGWDLQVTIYNVGRSSWHQSQDSSI